MGTTYSKGAGASGPFLDLVCPWAVAAPCLSGVVWVGCAGAEMQQWLGTCWPSQQQSCQVPQPRGDYLHWYRGVPSVAPAGLLSRAPILTKQCVCHRHSGISQRLSAAPSLSVSPQVAMEAWLVCVAGCPRLLASSLLPQPVLLNCAWGLRNRWDSFPPWL